MSTVFDPRRPLSSDPLRVVLLASLIVLQICDILTTNHVIARGGFESNPLISRYMENWGRLYWLPKIGLVLGAIPFLWRFQSHKPAWLAVVLYALAVLNNVVALL